MFLVVERDKEAVGLQKTNLQINPITITVRNCQLSVALFCKCHCVLKEVFQECGVPLRGLRCGHNVFPCGSGGAEHRPYGMQNVQQWMADAVQDWESERACRSVESRQSAPTAMAGVRNRTRVNGRRAGPIRQCGGCCVQHTAGPRFLFVHYLSTESGLQPSLRQQAVTIISTGARQTGVIICEVAG